MAASRSTPRAYRFAYSVFDKLQRVTHAAIVDNKRLGEVLAWIKKEQDERLSPSGDREGPRQSHQRWGIMKKRFWQGSGKVLLPSNVGLAALLERL